MSDANFQTPSSQAVAGESMTTPETLMSIFFEPGRTFAALRERPRFLVAALIIVVLTAVVTVILFQKVDFADFMRQRMAARGTEMSEQQIEMSARFGKIIGQVLPPVGLAVVFAAGAALYLLGVMALGGKISYKQALAVWVYSEFPPAVLMTVVSLLLLFLKPSDSIDLTRPGGGLLVTNPAAFFGPGTSRALLAALSAFDLFRFYGLYLAATGLRKVARISSGAAWTIVIALWLIATVLSVAWAAISPN